jgi:hypothetical protein
VIVVKILPNDRGQPPDKLADAELHFRLGPLEGMKLVGFAVWERWNGEDLNVSLPVSQSFETGERRTSRVLRSTTPGGGTDAVKNLILDAFAAYEMTIL